MINKDFTVYLHERYGMTKEQFCDTMKGSAGHTLRYEEESSMHELPNVDYNSLFVGAKLYADSAPESCCACVFDEVEITHIYGGIVFFKYLEGNNNGIERFAINGGLNFNRRLYPKVVVKPDFFDMTCDCDKTKFVNYNDQIILPEFAIRALYDTQRAINAINDNLPQMLQS